MSLSTPSAAPRSLNYYLVKMAGMNASDLFLRTGTPPAYRVNGEIIRTSLPGPDEETMKNYVSEVLTPLAAERFATSPDVDVAYTIEGRGRFRLSLFAHQGQLGHHAGIGQQGRDVPEFFGRAGYRIRTGNLIAGVDHLGDLGHPAVVF